MGESCTGVISLVDRNVTVCQYDVTKEDRMCIFHADCLQGQRCSRNKDGTFVCTTSIEAALGTVPCTYDYECSGGENCVNIADQGKEKVNLGASNSITCKQTALMGECIQFQGISVSAING
ncbi:hypothetical protein ANCCEY_03937 [Ancylostoma ceylanicum]|uniref:Uncharacterized protein n=1 Tax=Ancylostoma ceylanicum TaxID=53326 RepID=A0A0D6LYS0_9BILA|nr:hypothetical protein ANCCEY_03937 [Ancylostoma ceylanicum]